jgi:hypothetical protein
VEGHLVREDLQVRVQADLEIAAVGMPLAGHAHVVHAVHAYFTGFFSKRPRAPPSRPAGRLILLAAEAAAETGHVHFHAVHRDAQHARAVRCTAVGPCVDEEMRTLPCSVGYA